MARKILSLILSLMFLMSVPVYADAPFTEETFAEISDEPCEPAEAGSTETGDAVLGQTGSSAESSEDESASQTAAEQDTNSDDASAEAEEPSSDDASAEAEEPSSDDASAEAEEPSSDDAPAEAEGPSSDDASAEAEGSASENTFSEDDPQAEYGSDDDETNLEGDAVSFFETDEFSDAESIMPSNDIKTAENAISSYEPAFVLESSCELYFDADTYIEEYYTEGLFITYDMILTAYVGEAYDIILPVGTVSIASDAFSDTQAPVIVHIPDSVIDIACDAFTAPENITIAANADSYAISYAAACGIAYSISDFDGTITGASITISDSLSVNYYVSMNDECAALALMRFTVSGSSTLVKGCRAAENTWCFTCSGISADMMSENISAELLYGQNKIVADSIPEYSVQAYACNTYSSTSDAGLKQLLADMLFYGAAAQAVTGCNADSPVDSPTWVSSMRTSSFNVPASDAGSFGPGGSASIAGAGLSIDDTVSIRFEFAASDPTGISVDLYRSGVLIRTSTLAELASGSGYSLKTDGISASKFDTVYTAVLIGPEGIIEGCSFSVRSYVHSVSDGSDAISALLRAMYNYGKSAAAYTGYTEGERAGELTLTGPVTITMANADPASTESALQSSAVLTCTVSPASAAQSVIWYSSDTTVATVSPSGCVQAVAPGECVIYAYSIDGSGAYASMKITVSSDRTYGIFTYTVNDGKVTITGLSSAASSGITFPSSIDGMPVEAIDLEGFADCANGANVTSVSIPSGIKLPDQFFIMNNCLYAYTGAGPEAIVPCGVTAIADYAFKNNSGIESILLPEGLLRIGTEAFYGCSKLDSVSPYAE